METARASKPTIRRADLCFSFSLSLSLFLSLSLHLNSLPLSRDSVNITMRRLIRVLLLTVCLVSTVLGLDHEPLHRLRRAPPLTHKQKHQDETGANTGGGGSNKLDGQVNSNLFYSYLFLQAEFSNKKILI